MRYLDPHIPDHDQRRPRDSVAPFTGARWRPTPLPHPAVGPVDASTQSAPEGHPTAPAQGDSPTPEEAR
ncbi:hypothetical protein [Nocardiopsis sp. MG754419]|uniref:hypothetical protein n=1 Tax=Nocardiopsis sp. MG754419 TaxID=2259865 RepID=UPI001BA93250|nr:hypothetical protein [Nocardiopsis sp. MG754419]MBR8745083.1 hypothetical protein [Nocardiopsis sp. MG754419]